MAISTMKAIQTYFSSGPHGSKVSIAEMKALAPEDRKELGELAAVELGEIIALPKSAA